MGAGQKLFFHTEVKPMKRRLLLAAVITICLSMAAYGTLAFFTAEDTAHNVITSGGVDIDLLERAESCPGRRSPKLSR